MKCEICHEKAAQTAIGTDGDGEELYVCKECAERERAKRQKRRERTRKSQEAAATANDADEPPPIVKAFVNAVSDMVDGLERAVREQEDRQRESAKAEESFEPLTGFKTDSRFMLRGGLHLEGLHILGEMEAVQRSVAALGLRLEGINIDGLYDVGHVYHLSHKGDAMLAERFAAALVEQEANARHRLQRELTRLFGDAVCRALAILKNCRLLSDAEYFDLLSPLRLAVFADVVEGIKPREIERILKAIPLEQSTTFRTIEEREDFDAERADEVNRRFEDVILTI